MSEIDRFEDLDAWKHARVFVTEIYRESKQGELKTNHDTRSQLKRASLSIMNNIAEGFARYSNKEFVRFLEFSDASAAEVKSMMYVLEDVAYLEKTKAEEYRQQVDTIRRLILGLIRYLRKQDPKK